MLTTLTLVTRAASAATYHENAEGVDLLWLQDLSSSAENELTDLSNVFQNTIELLYYVSPSKSK